MSLMNNIYTEMVLEALLSFESPKPPEIQEAISICEAIVMAGTGANQNVALASRAVEVLDKLNGKGLMRGIALRNPELARRCSNILERERDTRGLANAARRLSMEVVLGLDGFDSFYKDQSRLFETSASQESKDTATTVMLGATVIGIVVFAFMHAVAIRASR